jgi:hypothetical protein
MPAVRIAQGRPRGSLLIILIGVNPVTLPLEGTQLSLLGMSGEGVEGNVD